MKNGWMALSRSIGIAVSTVLLTIVWITVFGLYAIALKCWCLVGGKSDKRDGSWEKIHSHDMERQF